MMNIEFERKLQNQGYRCILGADEVGYGSLALDFLTVAVIIENLEKAAGIYIDYTTSKKTKQLYVNDSKVFNSKTQIPELYSAIRKSGVIREIGYGWVSVEEINTIANMKKVQQLGFDRAIKSILDRCDVIITGDVRPSIDLKNRPLYPIIDADSKCVSVALASICAKAIRDSMCRKMSLQYPEYDWANNCGYRSPKHLAAMRKYGLTPYHRIHYKDCKSILDDKNQVP